MGYCVHSKIMFILFNIQRNKNTVEAKAWLYHFFYSATGKSTVDKLFYNFYKFKKAQKNIFNRKVKLNRKV